MTTDSVRIGNATLYCGDCFSVLPTLDLESDAVISDPPFGITSCDWDVPIPLASFWNMVEDQTKLSANFVLFACGRFSVDLVNSKYRWYRYDLVWQKNRKVGFLNANLMPMRNHESILVFNRPGFCKGATYNPQKTPGGRKGVKRTKPNIHSVYSHKGCISVSDGMMHPCSVLPFESDLGQHPTQKPVALMEFLVRSYTNEADVVIDPFMGSGTTGVASMNTGRQFIGIEQKREYFDVACQRIEQAHVNEAAQTKQEGELS